MRYRRVRIEGGTYFFTVVTYKRRKLFLDDAHVKLLQTCFAAVAADHPFKTDAQVILPDHIHAMWTLPAGDANYSMRWRQIKSAFSRRSGLATDTNCSISRTDKGERTVWQRRFWEHTVSDDDDFWYHLEYIHRNPVSHELVTRPRDWPHSTFHDWVARGRYDINWGVW